MPDQPSKESLGRAAKLVDWWLSYPDGGDDPESRTLRDRLALEFDAVSKERDAALIHANSGLELVRLRQQNAALASALREVRDMVFNLPSGVDENASENNCSPEDASAHIGGLIAQRINAALASYAPAEAKAQEKP